MYENYHKTRLNSNGREKVWIEIINYLQNYIKDKNSILDLGCGYCDFINNVPIKKKIAVDKYIDPKPYADKDVISLFGDYNLIDKKVKNESLDIVFASNFFEHITDQELENYIKIINQKLKKNGLIILIQPNFKLCYKSYFDDYTHKKVWSDTSLTEFFKSKNFSIILSKPRFMPLTIKSKLPKSRLLIRAYLYSPIKPLAGQMLIIGKKD